MNAFIKEQNIISDEITAEYEINAEWADIESDQEFISKNSEYVEIKRKQIKPFGKFASTAIAKKYYNKGQTISGALGDKTGSSVAINSNGERIAVGSSNADIDFNVGLVEVTGGVLPSNSAISGKKTNNFFISVTEITWGEWKEVRSWAVLNGYDLQNVGQGISDSHPVTNVNWFDCVKWCNAKSEMNKLSPVYILNDGDIYRSGNWAMGDISDVKTRLSNGYKLPSEAEWEWAARGGVNSAGYNYSGGNDLNLIAWYSSNSNLMPHPVAQKVPNELGLFDMTGNVREWCEDTVLLGVLEHKIIKGGAWWEVGTVPYTVNDKQLFTPDSRTNSIGFRIARYDSLILLTPVGSGTLSVSVGSGGTRFIPSFQLDKYETTLGEWNTVRAWASNNGYSDLTNLAQAPSNSHPVGNISGIDAMKWCNAKSEREGKKPYYYLSESSIPLNMIIVEGGYLPTSSLLANKFVNSFQISKFEVTWGEWKEVRDWAISNGYADLAGIGAGVDNSHPVHSINFYHAIKWCNAKSEKEGLTPVYKENIGITSPVYRNGEVQSVFLNKLANGYRLPTEIEWEWAARGALTVGSFVYSGDDNLNLVGWFSGNTTNFAEPKTQPVGSKLSNSLGIHDMSGNVWEWLWTSQTQSNLLNNLRSIRGGSWFDDEASCRVSFRSPDYNASLTSNKIGFRVARNNPRQVYRVGDTSVNGRIVFDLMADGYRLPTTFEWRWAARGGDKGQNYTYPGSNDLNLVAWYADNSGGSSKIGGQKLANELGLFDMAGNLFELTHGESASNFFNFTTHGGWFGHSIDDYMKVPYIGAGLPAANYSTSGLGFRVAANLSELFLFENRINNGKVEIFEFNDNQWVKLGDEIRGLSDFDFMGAGLLGGNGIAMNNNGDIIAISSIGFDKDNNSNVGQVKVFEYKNNEWRLQNSDSVLDGLSAGDFTGNIDLNGAGDTLIVASPIHDQNINNIDAGLIRVFKYLPDDSNPFQNKKWKQLGGNIYGSETSACGVSVSINNEGNIIAFGCPVFNNLRGRVNILQFKDGIWQNLGNNILGEIENEFCGSSVELNHKGDRIVVAHPGKKIIRTYELKNSIWTRLGGDIVYGGNIDNEVKVRINKYGNIILISTPLNYEQKGKLEIYKYNQTNSKWNLTSSRIYGDSVGKFGLFVDMNDYGDHIIIGDPNYDDNSEQVAVDNDHGSVKVFALPSVSVTDSKPNSKITKKYAATNAECDAPQLFLKDKNLNINASYLLSKDIISETTQEFLDNRTVDVNFIYEGKRNNSWEKFTITKNRPLKYIQKTKKFTEKWFTAFDCPETNSCDILTNENECCSSCFSVALLGDSGYPPLTDDLNIINQIKNRNPDYVLHLGTVNYLNTSNINQYVNFVNANFRNLWGPDWLKKMYLSFGAYDLVSDYGNYIWQSLDLVKLATGNISGKRNYNFIVGDAHFFVINTGNLSSGILIDESKDSQILWSQQIAETIEAMRKSSSKWRILVSHKPPYSSNNNYFPGSEKVRTLGGVPLEELGIDIVLSSFVRNYEHLTKNNVHYIVQGLGGAPKHVNYSTIPIPANSLARYAQESSYTMMNIGPNFINFKTINILGNIVDDFTINKN